MKNEIGGYLELERYDRPEYYPNFLKFNLGRTAITWFLQKHRCTTLYCPRFLCESVTDSVRAAGIRIISYQILEDFSPDLSTLPDCSGHPLPEGTWIFVANHYGQLTDRQILDLKNRFGNLLLDFTHAFFQRPIAGIDAVVSVRKFFGVTDGAYLKTASPIALPDETDRSGGRFGHLIGRFEEDAGTYYQQMLQNAETYKSMPPRRMSALTENLLKSCDYPRIAAKRRENYRILDEALHDSNGLRDILRTPDVGPFCYPFYVEDGIRIRKELAKEKIFVPTYWNNVIKDESPDSLEYRYAANILALPCDQRYGADEMHFVAEAVLRKIAINI